MNGFRDPRAAAIVELEAALRADMTYRARKEIEKAVRSLRQAENPLRRLEATLPFLRGDAHDRVFTVINLLSRSGGSRKVMGTKRPPAALERQPRA